MRPALLTILALAKARAKRLYFAILARAANRQHVSMRICLIVPLVFTLGGIWVASASGQGSGSFPAPYNTEPKSGAGPLEARAAAAGLLRLPPGFKATLFAAEPDVQNPIALAWDARGRPWIAENFTYAESPRNFDLDLRDRILIFEDRDGDGHFDSRKVFTEDVQMLASLELGHGGVWLMCPPRLLFVPDRDRNDIPDAAPEVVLDGFNTSTENHHTFANGLRWGPDGWLYGRCGASSAGLVGVPGTPEAIRVPLRGGLWRFHPRHKTFEVLTHGTTNPWGHDWDAHGELFFINTVTGHLWHAIPGAHFTRSATIDPNPHVYTVISQHGDHYHFDTGKGLRDATAADGYGGGHVHVGMMIYQGDNWPAEFRGRLFTLNFHGRRANQDILERHGSGYIGRHAPDFFLASDPWFRGQEISCGPDGGVLVLDWSDIGECHESDGVHRTSGRIYKITHNDSVPRLGQDLETLDSSDLVRMHGHPNEWFVRQARRILTGRAVSGDSLERAREELRRIFEQGKEVPQQLRALWTLYCIGGADETFLTAQLKHADEHVRTWAIRLLVDHWPLDGVNGPLPGHGETARPAESLRSEFVRMAATEPSGLVRLALASTLQRLPVEHRQALAAPLLARNEDRDDHNLPLMLWYGLIPVAEANPAGLANLGVKCQLPQTQQFIARRLGEDIEKNPAPLAELLTLGAEQSEQIQDTILAGLSEALRGWRKATPPPGWEALQKRFEGSSNASLRARARDLAAVFGDGRALEVVKRVVLDSKAELAMRKSALQTLIETRPPDLRQICEQLLAVRFLNSVAARGLAVFDDPAVAGQLAKAYRSFHPTERPQLLGALVSRPTFARALLEAVAAGKIPRTEISAFHARQIRGFNDPALTQQLSQVWGEVHESAAAKRQFITSLRPQLTPAALRPADKSQGRLLFSTLCASCHKLYGQGAAIGPDLTGSGRDNLDYLLENIVDPAAIVTADFRLTVVTMKDGRILNGVIKARTERTLTLQTVPDLVTVERSEIASLEDSALSLMPEGALEALSDAQRRDLIAYLMAPTQVPLP